MHGRDNHDYYRRERSRDKGYRGRQNSEEKDHYDRKKYRDYGNDNYKDYSHHRSRSRSNQKDKGRHNSPGYGYQGQIEHQYSRQPQQTNFNQTYPQKQIEQTEHKLRMAIRNNEIQFDPKLLQILRNLPASKQEQLTEQAHSHDKINQCILVRELFISGLADMNEPFISNIMGQYGEIEKIEIIKNFAYVKFNRVEDASNACAEYHNINIRIHSQHNPNFKIFFADHVKRWNVVSNNIQYQNQEDLVPVIYASIINQKPYNTVQFLREGFQKFGYVRNIEVKPNELPGPKVYKSYVLVEYETLAQTLRARQRIKLNREKYLGDRKSQVTLLIDSDKLTRSCPNVKNQLRYQRKRQITNASNQAHQNINMQQGTVNPFLQHTGQQNHHLPQMGQHQNNNYYQQNMNLPNMGSNQPNVSQNNDIFAMIQQFAQKQDHDQNDEQNQSDWVGFLTRNKQFKVQVDFKLIHKVQFQLESLLNVSHRADIQEAVTRDDYIFAGKFRSANSLNNNAFSQYIKYFIKKNKSGIIQSKNYLIYLIPSLQDVPMPYAIKSDEILALFYKLN